MHLCVQGILCHYTCKMMQCHTSVLLFTPSNLFSSTKNCTKKSQPPQDFCHHARAVLRAALLPATAAVELNFIHHHLLTGKKTQMSHEKNLALLSITYTGCFIGILIT